ncbi:MAG TPA: DUF2191 domain-containing protein [Kiritimatiellia bacterium]|nr:DUF2191 domain-containing protein [Kiritimatiellia bacterium]
MKTTVDIPDSLYRKAKIQAVREGTTLKHLIVTTLSQRIEGQAVRDERTSYFARRKLHPMFQGFADSGHLSGGRDSTESISEDRDDRAL